jgi:hypothetical protein
MTRQYDSTVARIAGNIASGLLDAHELSACVQAGTIGPYGEQRIRHLALFSVTLAREIVAETIMQNLPSRSKPEQG